MLSGSLRSPPHQIFNLLWESKIYLSHVQLGPRPPTSLPTPTVPRLQSLHFQQLSTTYRVKAEHGSGWQAERAAIQPFLATLPHALGPATVIHSRAHSRGHTFSCLRTVHFTRWNTPHFPCVSGGFAPSSSASLPWSLLWEAFPWAFHTFSTFSSTCPRHLTQLPCKYRPR